MSKTRHLIRDKFGGKCAYCGCDLGDKFHVDQFLPVKRKKKVIEGRYVETLSGASVWVKRHFENDGFDFPERNVLSNMIPACASCNINKRDQTIDQFREMISNFINSLNKRFVQYKFAKKFGLIQETEKPVLFYFETYNQSNQ